MFKSRRITLNEIGSTNKRDKRQKQNKNMRYK